MQVQAPPPPPGDVGTQIRDAIRTRVRDEIATDEAPVARVVVQPPPTIPDIPRNVEHVAYAVLFFLAATIILTPIARAIARWIDRRSQGPARLPSDVTGQLAQLTQAVDAIAVEVERISEGQRFTTKLLSNAQAQQNSIAAPRGEVR